MKTGIKIGIGMMLSIMLFCLIVPIGVSAGSATIKISYNGDWSGSIGEDDSTRSVSGSGTKTYSETGSIIVAVIQKQDDSTDTLRVEIIVDGKVVESESTTASYGVVSVSHSFLEEEAEEAASIFCGTCAIVSIIVVIIAVVVGILVYKQMKSKKKEKTITAPGQPMQPHPQQPYPQQPYPQQPQQFPPQTPMPPSPPGFNQMQPGQRQPPYQ